MSAANGRRTLSLGDAFTKLSQFERENRFDEANALAEQMLRALPEHPHVLHFTGIIAHRSGRIEEALERMEASYKKSPHVALYARNLCDMYRSVGRLDEALQMGKRAIELAPSDVRAYLYLALTHYERLELDDAIAVAEQALELDPNYAEAHFGKAEALLAAGRMAEGWESYEWRFCLKQAEGMLPKTDKPQWDGRPLKPGRLLIIGDQGFGDCIQFSRFIPWVASICPNPILACSDALHGLMRQIPGVTKIVRKWEETGNYDAYIPLSGLPRLAGVTAENVPSANYIAANSKLVTVWGDKLDRLTPRNRRRIALVWAGRPSHKNDRKRSMRLEQFAPLFARDDIVVVTVQKGESVAQIGGYFQRAQLLNLGPEINDFDDTIAILRNVERLVTIDTSVAHIAGTIGVPTSLVLPYAPDWRWLLDREDTPWYRSLRLFRQERPYDWSGVIERVAEAL